MMKTTALALLLIFLAPPGQAQAPIFGSSKKAPPPAAKPAPLVVPPNTVAIPPSTPSPGPTPAPSTEASEVTLLPVASRISGVAPLAVFFDATGTTATAITPRPFHEIEYRWNFGDATSGTWGSANGAGSRPGLNSRNTATGPVAAHVFEKPGTYNVIVTATYGKYLAVNQSIQAAINTITNRSIQITVDDPDAVFSGNNTICVAAASLPVAGAAGCPAGAAVAQQANFVTVLSNYALTGKRVLLKKGDTFTAGANAVLNKTGPGIIGAYGSGALPVVKATNNVALLQLSSPTTPRIADWRIMDIELHGNGNDSTNGISPNGGINQVTALRVYAHHMHNPFIFSAAILDYWNKNGSPGHNLYDQIAIVDSKTTNVTGGAAALSVYGSATRVSLLGNTFDNNGGGEHTVRFESVVKGVVGNNTFQGAGSSVGSKHAFTLRAALFGSNVGVQAGRATQFVVVADNKFIGSSGGAWTVFYGPEEAADMRVVDTITERNWFVAGSGQSEALHISAHSRTSVRNNIFDTSGALSHGAMSIKQYATSVFPDSVWVYNNTAYSGDAGRDFVILDISNAVTKVIAKNNLGWAPNDTQHNGVVCNGSNNLTPCTAPPGSLIVLNNSTPAQIKNTDPQFISTSPFNPANARPALTSYAVTANNSCNGLPCAWSDLYLTPRQSAGIGAVFISQ